MLTLAPWWRRLLSHTSIWVLLSKKGVHERITGGEAELKADRSRKRNLGHCGLRVETDSPKF